MEDILENDYSVRQVEKLVKEILDGSTDEVTTEPTSPKEVRPQAKPDYNELLWEEKLSVACNLNVKVKLNPSGKGQVVIPFNNESDLQDFFAKLS